MCNDGSISNGKAHRYLLEFPVRATACAFGNATDSSLEVHIPDSLSRFPERKIPALRLFAATAGENPELARLRSFETIGSWSMSHRLGFPEEQPHKLGQEQPVEPGTGQNAKKEKRTICHDKP